MDVDGWLYVADSCFVCETAEVALAVPFKNAVFVGTTGFFIGVSM